MLSNAVRKAIHAPAASDTRAPNIMRLCICIPSNGQWLGDFGMSVAGLCTRLMRGPAPNGFDGVRLDIKHVTSSALPMNRQALAEYALATGASHLLLLDSDMIFPEDIVYRLAQHNKDIVLCECASRHHFPPQSTTRFMEGPRTSSLCEVEASGLAIAMIKASVLQSIQKPWFNFEYTGQGELPWIGEDFYFFRKAKQAGFRVYADLDLSKEIGHVGAYNYTLGATLHAGATAAP